MFDDQMIRKVPWTEGAVDADSSQHDCWYGLGGLNYKHGYTSCCAIQHNRLAWFKDSYLPSEIYNSKNFVKLRNDLTSGKWPSGCNLCQEMVEKGVR